ncbi:hypothetical protein [Bartonella sp. HY761]|uniref:hypothetical protein n=1 Tax=Bartonella sp. HY761 TaxID=2979330 RepID=UPI00220776F5|nr:hypothetical protein [Bartonella sp. HY761]UXN05579.1 hypothetical protein N6A79_09760 [Bartonella sp. HY761]
MIKVQHSDGFSLKFENYEAGQRRSVKWLVDGGEARLVTYHYEKLGFMFKMEIDLWGQLTCKMKLN